jgi:hypothetical protein
VDTRESSMSESILDTLLDQTNSPQTHPTTPTWGSDIDWSVPPHVGGLVATGKDRDSSLNDVLLTHRQATCTDPLMKTTSCRACLHMRWRRKAFLLLCQHLPVNSLVACTALCRWMVQPSPSNPTFVRMGIDTRRERPSNARGWGVPVPCSG